MSQFLFVFDIKQHLSSRENLMQFHPKMLAKYYNFLQDKQLFLLTIFVLETVSFMSATLCLT